MSQHCQSNRTWHVQTGSVDPSIHKNSSVDKWMGDVGERRRLHSLARDRPSGSTVTYLKRDQLVVNATSINDLNSKFQTNF
jgi:hypothetical protein